MYQFSILFFLLVSCLIFITLYNMVSKHQLSASFILQTPKPGKKMIQTLGWWHVASTHLSMLMRKIAYPGVSRKDLTKCWGKMARENPWFVKKKTANVSDFPWKSVNFFFQHFHTFSSHHQTSTFRLNSDLDLFHFSCQPAWIVPEWIWIP